MTEEYKEYKDEAGITIKEDSDGNKIAMAHPVAYNMAHEELKRKRVSGSPPLTNRNSPHHSHYWVQALGKPIDGEIERTVLSSTIELRDTRTQHKESQWIEQTRDWHKRQGADRVVISRVVIVKSWEDQ